MAHIMLCPIILQNGLSHILIKAEILQYQKYNNVEIQQLQQKLLLKLTTSKKKLISCYFTSMAKIKMKTG